MVKNEKHVSAFLQLRSATEGIVVTLDFSFSVLSKEHFTKVTGIAKKEERRKEGRKEGKTKGRKGGKKDGWKEGRKEGKM